MTSTYRMPEPDWQNEQHYGDMSATLPAKHTSRENVMPVSLKCACSSQNITMQLLSPSSSNNT